MADDTYSRSPRYPFTRGSAPAQAMPRGAGNDPLSELARLIGQDDPFAEAARPAQRDYADAPAPSYRDGWPERHGAASANVGHADEFSDYQHDPGQDGGHPDDHAQAGYSDHAEYRDQNGYDEPHADQQHDYAYSEPAPTAPIDHPTQAPQAADNFDRRNQPPAFPTPTQYGAQPDTPFYGDDGQLSPQDTYAQEHYDYQEPPPRRRGGLMVVAGVLGLAVIGTAGAYAYRTMFTGGPAFPPLIKADTTPSKVQPAPAIDTPKQYNERVGGSPSGEQIVPREEQPVDVKPPSVRVVAPSTGTPSTAMSPQAAAPATAAPSGAAPAPGEPRRVRTVTIRQDQAIAPVGGAPTAGAPPASAPTSIAPPTASARAPAPAPVQDTPPVAQAPAAPQPRAPRVAAQTPAAAPPSGAPMSLSPTGQPAEAPMPVTPTPPRAPKVAARQPAAAATTSAAGGYVVQISAQKTHEEAVASFRSAQQRYSAVLSGQQMLIKKKDVPGKGVFYGAQVGPFAGREDAIQMCEQIKSAGGSCIVQKN